MKSTKFIFLIILILNCSGSGAYEISAETLLRNPSNGSMFTQEIITKWEVKSPSSDGKNKKIFLGLAFGSEIFQFIYADSLMKAGKYTESSKFPIGALDEKKPSYIFYSVLKLVLQNDGRPLMQKMAKDGISFASADQLLNKEKFLVMKSYKEKLKEPGGFDEAKKSDEYKKLKQVFTAPYFHEDKLVVLKKEKSEIFLVIEKNNWALYFDYETRRLKRLVQHSLDKSITIELNDYSLTDTDHWVPGEIKLLIGAEQFTMKLLKSEIGKNKLSGIALLKRSGPDPLPFIN